jgi:hypothetical protein
MILALAFNRPDISKFLNELDSEDFKQWMAFYLRSPWGPTRDDMRNSVLITLLLSSFGGSSGNMPNVTFPYFSAPVEHSIDVALEMEKALEPDGQGGYRWRDGKKPQSLIDEEARIEAAEKERSSVPLW